MKRPLSRLLKSPSLYLAAVIVVASCAPSEPELASVGAPVDADVRAGEALVAKYGCTNCHDADATRRERLAGQAGPDLSRVGERLTWPGLVTQIIEPRPRGNGEFLCGANTSPEDAVVLANWIRGEHYVDTESVAVLPSEVEMGRVLFDSIGCVACHRGDDSKGGLLVDSFEGDYTIDSLARLLGAGREPGGKTWHPSFGLDASEAKSLASFVLVGDRAGFERSVGLRVEYYEPDSFDGGEPDWDRLEVVRSGVAVAIDLSLAEREDSFGLRFSGEVFLESPGSYEFYLTSDDGSTFDLDGRRVIDHGGLHGPDEKSATLELEAGFHPIEVTMFEQSGGEALSLEFALNGLERLPLGDLGLFYSSAIYTAPAQLSMPRLKPGTVIGADDGQQNTTDQDAKLMFEQYGCANCHTATAGERQTLRAFRPIEELASNAGCLLAEVPHELGADTLVPRFAFHDQRRITADLELKQLNAYMDFESKPAGALEEKLFVDRELARLNCLACHTRDGAGGPPDSLEHKFGQAYDGDDLGAEGHLPPTLTGVGAKLTPEWLVKVIAEGSRGAGSRPYVQVQMPSFQVDVAADLARALEAVDVPLWAASHPSREEPLFSEEIASSGHVLVGTGGFACIACHLVDGKNSLGLPMIDLASTTTRLRYPWFREWLEHPTEMRKGTRMASFWSEGTSARADIFEGDADRQIQAIWSYLSLGVGLPLPAGLVTDPGAYDLLPLEEPIYHACFLRDASARGMAVGFPERKHLAFDFQHLRLHSLWYGDFVNAAATWDGRAGGLIQPEGTGVLLLPEGLAVARLEDQSTTWPQNKRRPDGWRLLGHKRSPEGIPTFRYALGETIVEETLQPVFGARGHFLRKFRISGIGHDALFLRLGSAKNISFHEDTIRLQGTGILQGEPDGEVTLRLVGRNLKPAPPVTDLGAGATRFLLTEQGSTIEAQAIAGDLDEVLVPILPNAQGVFEIEVGLQW